MLKCLVDSKDFVWQLPRKNPTQMLYRSDSVFIKSIIIYAVNPLLVHNYSLTFSSMKKRRVEHRDGRGAGDPGVDRSGEQRKVLPQEEL